MKSNKNLKELNKKGNLLSIWWFFILAIVGAGIVVGALIFYGADTDVKKLEADILSDRILNCIVSQGVINMAFVSGDSDYIFAHCGLSKELLTTKGKYMIKIYELDESGGIKEIVKYGEDMEVNCGIHESVRSAKGFPYCSTKTLELLDSNGKSIKLKIVTGSSYIKGSLYALSG